MVSRSKRILWLLNHTTLRSFEVPLLRTLGYEVYTSKLFPGEPGNRSASTDYSWDDQLTLPREVVDLLNSVNFYSDPISPTIRRLINAHFETAIIAYMFPMLDNIIQHFGGRILLRAFGSTSSDWNYFSYAKHLCDPGFTRRLARVLHRFWFAQAYPNLELIEPTIVRGRAVTLPVGLPESITNNRGSWRLTKRQILFVCPDIEVFDESRQTYLKFKEHFGGYPHRICGAQQIVVKGDPHVTGYLSREAYDQELAGSAVMFYHSELPRHLHYHPIEAICIGLPLIFMRRGMLGELGGSSLPGSCATYDEARRKTKRILDGDEEFAQSVIDSQRRLLSHFLWDSCLDQWTSVFVNGVMRSPVLPPKDFAKIAVLCMEDSTDCASVALSLADGLQRQALKSGQAASVLAGISDSLRTFVQNSRIAYPDVPVREFGWKTLDPDSVRRAQELQGVRSPLTSGSYRIANDGMSHFMDCDFWIVVGSGASVPIAPVKAYALFVSDLSRLRLPEERYSIEAEEALVKVARGAVAVMSHSRAALEDVHRHWAIPRDFLISVSTRSTACGRMVGRDNHDAGCIRPTLLWLAAFGSPFFHSNAIDMLEPLLSGSNQSYEKVVVIGKGLSGSLDSNAAVTDASSNDLVKFRHRIHGNAALRERIVFEGDVDFDRWTHLLSQCAVVWWPSWSAGGVEICRMAVKRGATVVAHQSPYIAELGAPPLVIQIEDMQFIEHAAALKSAARNSQLLVERTLLDVDFEELWSQLQALL